MSEARRDRNPGGGVWHPWRWPVNVKGSLREQGVCDLPVRVVDVSLTGCRVKTGFRTKVGARTRVTVADFTPFAGTIVWSDQSHAAVEFDEPLHLSVVRHITALGPADAETMGPSAAMGGG